MWYSGVVGGVGVYGLTGLSEALSSKAYARAVCKAGPGRGGSHKEEMKGLASKPQGKGSGTGTEGAMDNRQLLQHRHKQGRRAAARRPWTLLDPCLRQA